MKKALARHPASALMSYIGGYLYRKTVGDAFPCYFGSLTFVPEPSKTGQH